MIQEKVLLWSEVCLMNIIEMDLLIFFFFLEAMTIEHHVLSRFNTSSVYCQSSFDHLRTMERNLSLDVKRSNISFTFFFPEWNAKKFVVNGMFRAALQLLRLNVVEDTGKKNR